MVDSFSGDGVMILFGGAAPDLHHALHATTCALLIQETVRRINARRVARGGFPVWFRIGVNSGTMAQCNLGSAERMQHTVIGDTVNLASRLCGIGGPGEITIGEDSAATHDVAERFRLQRRPRQPVQGRNGEVVPFRVDSLKPAHQAQLQHLLADVLPMEPT
jgi:adenylate cyclase